MLEENIRTGLTFDDVLLVPRESCTLPPPSSISAQSAAGNSRRNARWSSPGVIPSAPSGKQRRR